MKTWFFIIFFLVFATSAGAASPEISYAGATWRIRIHDAAVAPGNMVTLGDIGEIHGTPPPGVWEQLANRPLWPAPPEAGKPLQVSRARLSQALKETLGELADMCILPNSLAIQRGGTVVRDAGLRALVVKTLTPEMNALPGEAELTDFRLPPYAFLAHAGQSLELEPVKLNPGRLSLRFVVKEVDGSVLRRFTGTVLLDLWANVPCAGKPLNRGDALSPSEIIWQRQNMAHIRGELWDGKGGPWQVQRAIGTGQPLYMADLTALAMVRKGDIVTLRFQRGNVRLDAQAEVLTDGGPGDTVTVRNLQSKKQVFATVRDANTVETK